MIDFKKNKYNLIIGALLGFILAQLILIEGNAIISMSLQNNEIVDTGVVANNISYFKMLALIIFIATIVVFNAKHFRNINFDKISIYLVLVVLTSLIVAFEGTFLLIFIFIKLYPNIIEYVSSNYFFSINLAYLGCFIGGGMFLVTFILLVNRKVKYIKFLTKEVRVIKEEGFGKIIKVVGGDELSELCQSINNMSIELGEKIENEKRIENNKNELITNISHDLKTPLTSIVGYLELLNNKDIDESTRDEYTCIAYSKSLRLKELVNELFEYTKLASNDIKLEKNKVNIAMLLSQAVGESIINFSEKNIDVKLDIKYEEAFSYVDAVQMLRVFENLIKNAEKYGDVNSEFKVSLNIINKEIVISFINKCENIEGKDLERFFERFYREDKSRNKEGAGLGLAIVKRIIDLHEGKILVNKIGNDIKFEVVLDKA